MNTLPVSVSLLLALVCACGTERPAETTTGSGGVGGGGGASSTAGGAAGGRAGSAGSSGSAGSAGALGNTAGSGGSGGNAGQGGSSGSGGDGGFQGILGMGGALDECAAPSIDRLKGWDATSEGTMVPQSGSLLVLEGSEYVAKVSWLNNEWHVVPVNVGNQWETSVDLSMSAGFWLTYSATAEFWVQLRSATHWDGGKQYLTSIPTTGGATQTKFISFAKDNWTTREDLGVPEWSYEVTLADVRGLVFVGNTANELHFSGLRIDGYVPSCLE